MADHYEQATAAPNERRSLGFHCEECGTHLEPTSHGFERPALLEYVCPRCQVVRRVYVRQELPGGHFRYARYQDET